MVKYININNKLQYIENSIDKIFTKDKIQEEFENFIAVDGYKVVQWLERLHLPNELLIEKDNNKIHIILYLKNLTGAGWANRPGIRRVQVSNIRKDNENKYDFTTANKAFMILGYYNYDNNPIMVGWNIYNYVYHKTNRSCYIKVEDIMEGYKRGYYVSEYSGQKLWVFKANYFSKFLEEYINDNRVGD